MTTKGRPKAAQQVLDECWQTGMRQPAVMYVDGNPAGYDFQLPDNWKKVEGNGNLAGSKQWVFTNYPNERVYGWLADDNHPKSPNWSYIIEEVAHPWHLVHCRDRWISREDKHALEETRNLGGGICWGGELVRCVGWWAPPGIIQASIDWAWTSLVGKTALGVYLDNVIVEHHNWRTGKRKMDANDETIIQETMPDFVKRDIETVRNWINSKDFKRTQERIIREYTRYITG